MDPYPVYPLGMTTVACAARSQGHEVVEKDLLVAGVEEDDVSSLVGQVKPDLIGLSIRNIDNTDSSSFMVAAG